jgi:hypothetical protein
MGFTNARDLQNQLENAGGEEVKVLPVTRLPNGTLEVRADMFGYKTNEVTLHFLHRRFLRKLSEFFQDDPTGTVLLLGRADRQNRSGKAAVNQKVSDDRARNAEKFLLHEFEVKGIDPTGRFDTRGISDSLAHRDGPESNERDRAVFVRARLGGR